MSANPIAENDDAPDAVTAALARIRTALGELSPSRLELEDESHRHEGHGGHRPGQLTHLRVRIEAEAFRGQSRLARHRAVNALLAGEIARGLHALAIEAKAPGE
ncbi:BolA family transcriptional regulator [Starkeya koreensis]|uniref:BolA family transcriptional regulator n=1 Tax=Ancylobacter koreensis TaxID=266121 RepID=A0ABT0DLU8_9HYPH|nr:BolA family protein [Ancylobacter koreensis]MCK0208253.1 BolA family transcriptional regulator [Ancylobacter koreensis]